ncbi:arylsulfatase [Algibacter mikhailovii]|uniref:Arylsulfatase n=1 Tax=Algibacter mikhailovii TaxID=425498 RepID=A0A918RE67_9FLAO|nr:arylsulfatase [Algibacter mikhailovii]GGZ92078.1 arylsulfatase [Algibacter mikhailovii]
MKLKFIGVIIVAIGFLSCKEDAKKQYVETIQNHKKPNIIYILADDLGYGDLSCYGQTKFKTPHIDKLASKGMLFTQHYSGSTVCAPSRSSLMTGMHTGHTIIRGNKVRKNKTMLLEGQYPMPDSTFTMAEMLKKKGYKTGVFGKWGLGFPGSEGDPINQGFDTFFGYNCQRLGHNYYPYHLWSNKDSITLTGNAGRKNEVYGPELIHEKTLQFIEDNKKEPFFLYVSSIIPHAELMAPEKAIKKFRGNFMPEKTFEGVDDGPEYRNGPYGSQNECHATFAAMVSILDEQVGEIMDKVKTLGIEEHTIIIFTSDNGPHKEGGADPVFFNSNGGLKGFKRDLYEGGIRVPMIVSWPKKIKANTKTDHISAFWDIFPTLGAVVNAKTPTNIDGISFLPTLLNNTEQQNQHEYLYWEFHEKGGRQAVRKGNWKAVKYNVLKQSDSPIELYNLSNDIKEANNLATENPEVVKEMESIINTARTSSSIFTFKQETYLNSN